MSIGYEVSIGPSHQQQQKQEEEQEQILQLSTEPLKIPLPKTGPSVKGPYTKSTSGTTPSTAVSTGTGSTTVTFNKFLDTQIFSIESRPDSASINKLGNLELDLENEREREKVDYSAFGTGYRAEVVDDKEEEESFGSDNVQEESDFESNDGNSPF